MSLALSWGTTTDERALPFPCDGYLQTAEAPMYRAVTVDAPPHIVFRWLCQMKVAPYSYDWIDNLGCKSPRELIPGLDQLAIGQRVMGQFRVVAFERDRHITICSNSRLGDFAATYRVVPVGPNHTRLLVKLLVRSPRGLAGWLMRLLLPWGDLLMMRRQLLNFKELAERTALAVTSPGGAASERVRARRR